MNLTWLFVAAVYAVAVFLARRAGIDLPRRVALFFYALVLLFFFSAMTGPYVNFQSLDIVPHVLPPWSHLTNYHHQFTVELNDLPLQIVPWMHQVRESWKSLTPPLWNSMSASGYPLLGNGQSSALSLLRILTLPLPLGHAVTAEAAMKVLIALTFTFLYCRRRYSLLASCVAAVIFGFSGFMVGWLHFPMATVACLAPAVLYCVDLLAERVTFGRFVFAAAVWVQQIFAGHPGTSAHLLWLALMYTLWRLFVERSVTMPRLRFLLVLGSVMIVAALLAAPVLAPVLEATPKSKRAAEFKASPPNANTLVNTDWLSGVAMLQPHFFGQVPHDKAWAQADTEAIAGWPGVFGWMAWLATALYVIASRSWRSRETFFVITTLFVVGVIFSWPGPGELFHLMIPVGFHARLRLLFTLLTAFQAAFVIDQVTARRHLPLLASALVTSIALIALLTIIPRDAAYRYDTAVLAMLPSLAVVAAATALGVTRKHTATMLLLVAVTCELFVVGRDRPTPVSERMLYPRAPLLDRLQELKARTPPDQPWRFTAIGPSVFPNLSTMYGLEDIRANDPMSYVRYLGFLRVTADYDAWQYYAFLRDADRSVYDFLNVKYLVLEPHTEIADRERYALVYDGRDGRIVENRHVLPRFYAVRNVLLQSRRDLMLSELGAHREWASTALLDDFRAQSPKIQSDFFTPRPEDAPLATAKIVKAETSEYRLHASAPRWSLVVSSIPLWPGWKIERNGERIKPMRVNGVFLGFAVPPGESEIRVWFAPWSFWAGVWISLATVVGIVVVRLFGLRRRSRRFPASVEA